MIGANELFQRRLDGAFALLRHVLGCEVDVTGEKKDNAQ
jgi:hypothetical protein